MISHLLQLLADVEECDTKVTNMCCVRLLVMKVCTATAQGVKGDQLDSGVLRPPYSASCVRHSPADAGAVGAISQAQPAALFHTHDTNEDYARIRRDLEQSPLTVNTCNLIGH